MSEDTLRREIAELRGALDDMARRVARLEHAEGRGPAPAPRPVAAAPADPGPDPLSLVATRAAVVCFVLVGALALRVVAQHGGLAPLPGAAMGLSYCALLIVVLLLSALSILGLLLGRRLDTRPCSTPAPPASWSCC